MVNPRPRKHGITYEAWMEFWKDEFVEVGKRLGFANVSAKQALINSARAFARGREKKG